jgi:carbon monoxide dehydrogenase subunit G
MQIEGVAEFKAPREKVYQIFTDKDALARATPGIKSMEQVGENKFEATMVVGVAGITGTYKGTMELTGQQPPESYVLAVEGQGAPGFVKGTAAFRFEPTPAGGTKVAYLWDLQVGGVVASVGHRVLGGVGKMMIGQFNAAMQKEVAR